MKKAHLAILAMAAAIVLSACQLESISSAAASSADSTASSLPASSGASTAPASSSSSASSIPGLSSSSSTSSSSPIDYEGALTDFLDSLAGSNATTTFADHLQRESLGTKAELVTYLGAYASQGNFGYLVNGTQGIFDFAIDSGAVVLGDIETPSPVLKVPDVIITISDLATTAAVWTSQKNYAYATTDSSVGEVMASLEGYGTYTEYAKAYDTTLTLEPTSASALIVSVLTIGTTSGDYHVTVTATVSAIGTTENGLVSSYLANPALVAAPTAWKEKTQDAMTSLLNEVLPFPSGLSYAETESVTSDAKGNPSSVAIADYASGDILSAYQDVLIADGWEVYGTETENESEGSSNVIYLYDKVKTPATATAGAVAYLVQLDYLPSSAFASSAARYPYGAFEIQGALGYLPLTFTFDEAGLNAYYAKITKEDGTAAIPSFAFGEEVTAIVLDDYTSEGPEMLGYDFVNLSIATLSIADEAAAAGDATAMGAALIGAGFLYESGTLADDKEISFSLSDAAFPTLGLFITIQLVEDGAGAYAGGIAISVVAA